MCHLTIHSPPPRKMWVVAWSHMEAHVSQTLYDGCHAQLSAVNHPEIKMRHSWADSDRTSEWITFSGHTIWPVDSKDKLVRWWSQLVSNAFHLFAGSSVCGVNEAATCYNHAHCSCCSNRSHLINCYAHVLSRSLYSCADFLTFPLEIYKPKGFYVFSSIFSIVQVGDKGKRECRWLHSQQTGVGNQSRGIKV